MKQLKDLGDLQFCDCVMKTVRGGRVAIDINVEFGPYFQPYSGVRHVKLHTLTN